MGRFTEQALTMLLSPSVKHAFDLSQESEKTKEAYGRIRVGQSVLMARRLVEAGCRFVSTSGYTHGAQVAERMVTMGYLFANLYKVMGIDWSKAYINPGGRPLYIANSIDDVKGQPLNELV